MHLLAGAVESAAAAAAIPATLAELRPGDSDRIGQLENEVLALRKELTDVQRQLAEFRKQFE